MCAHATCRSIRNTEALDDLLRLLDVTRYVGNDGVHRLVTRPPLHTAWQGFFKAHRRPSVLDQQSVQFETENGDVLVYYALKNMTPPNESAIEAAKQREGVYLKNKKWVGKAGDR